MIDLLIIGAGPAGLSAAIASARQGLAVRVIDEFYRPGGRLLGQLHEEPDGVWWNGLDEAARLTQEAIGLGVEIRCGVSVFHLTPSQNFWIVSTTVGEMIAPLLLIATGASEAAVPVPGWTLPGVMSIGAAQVMTNVQRVRVGQRGVVIGINILSVAISRELQLAGITVDRMILPPSTTVSDTAGQPQAVLQSLLRVAHLAPSLMIRWGSKLMRNSWMQKLSMALYPSNGFSMWDIPIQLRTAALEIIGTFQVEGVRIARVAADGSTIAGTEQVIPADFVCIAGGLSPLAELAAIAGCPFAYVPSLGGHVPLHNESMRTPVPGLYVAGNITGIESAKVAMAQGTVAGLSIAKARGKLTNEQRLSDAIQQVKIVRQNATIQFHPDIVAGRALVGKMTAEWIAH
ncbi:NAD(P)/FAD-dependent oxidoreductase [Brevibacillus formosus]|uniref:Sarcosine oxidase subunit alpha n=1 Tax=Brevibacillus formosus TaxID=54913 RepID=A0A837KJG2_9BACL|nr:NAD(P)/FAD-dependent oxidoreductase [Brevibacillus formosus]KLH97594.1 sarcosine oxidase subunit alpha [Brevibacillus formosus]MED1957616.1 NAD(P)/FAD-dependent oxidoreductase [Brevibacillus formosus]PSJ98999.1 FAD-dependent oxidoreductase [Brevibacillus formosus]GED57738.1 sarcosine oxidase subunit alpha [Brevibacillus formosus]